MKGMQGKSVMITGAAAGIGLATARRFQQEGAQLILVDLATANLKDEFSNATLIDADVASDQGVKSCADAMTQKGIHVLINNAGITRDAQILKMTREQWDQVLAVNLTAIFELSKAAALIMKEQNDGVILSASSVVAHYGNFGQANYAATKAAVIAFTQTLAKELGRFNVRVNAVAPGFIETSMVSAIPEKVLDVLRDKPALKRMGQPEEIAAAYAFLASDDARYITGTTLNVDGGIILG